MLQVCEATAGYPVPSLTWQRAGQQVGAGARLPLAGAGPEKAGRYTCRAENTEGRTEAVVMVTVFCEYNVNIVKEMYILVSVIST